MSNKCLYNAALIYLDIASSYPVKRCPSAEILLPNIDKHIVVESNEAKKDPSKF